MADFEEARINDPDYDRVLFLEAAGDNLRVIVTTSDDAIQMDLDDRGVADLRKALQRYERGRKSG